jgi:hypothetical protein
MATSGRALVLGSGGVTGIAWETGKLAGLAEAGIDLTSADLVVGTPLDEWDHDEHEHHHDDSPGT